MKGLEISKGYYLEYGAPMIREKFPEYESRLAVGLVGAGSECFGYDDELSRDHDFEPGFCIFVPDDLARDRKLMFELERAYAYLPKEYAGVKRQPLKPVGGNRHGVIVTGDFYEARIGRRSCFDNMVDLLRIPDHYLAEATNGEVFRDDEGEFSRVRSSLAVIPEDVRLKKLAGRLLLAAQSGQYNYSRCVKHGETAAAQLALAEFARHIITSMLLLERRYAPYYKWLFRALEDSPRFRAQSVPLEFLLSTSNDGDLPSLKQQVVEDVCSSVISELRSQRLASSDSSYLETYAYSVNDLVADPVIRGLNVLFAAE